MAEYAAAGENWAEKPASNAYCPSGLGKLDFKYKYFSNLFQV